MISSLVDTMAKKTGIDTAGNAYIEQPQVRCISMSLASDDRTVKSPHGLAW